MKILYWNREDLAVELKLLEPGKWLVSIDVDQPAWTEFIVGTRLQWYNPALPNHVIKEVCFDRYDVDPSGYEYFGWILYTK